MFFSKQDYEYLLSSLSKKYNLYSFIDNEYLIKMLDSLMLNGCFEELKLESDEMSKDMNPLFHISFKIQNYLYYKICKLCEDDIEVLLNLVEDKRRIINLIFRKMKVEDNSKIDDYIMNIASLYNGLESFDSFITRYVMSMIKGVPFVVEKCTTVNNSSDLEDDSNTKKKDKKNKKKKEKKKKNKIEDNSIVVEQVDKNSDELKDILVKAVNEAINDRKNITDISLYEKVLNKCNFCLGSGNRDNFIEMILMSDLMNAVTSLEDEKYRLYFLMRFGLMNESFYTREEIADILIIDLISVIEYEKFTISKLREFMNKAVNRYEEYILRK